MGELKNMVLGDSSGKVGSIVFLQRADVSYISKKHRRNKNLIPSAKEIAVREKFKLVGAVARGINKTDHLKAMWPGDSTKIRSKFNLIFTANYNQVGTVDSLGKPMITPSSGFPVTNGAITLNTTGLTFASDALGIASGADPTVEKYLIEAGIMILKGPTDPIDPSFKVITLRTGQVTLDIDTPVSLPLELTGDQLTDFQGYTTKKVHMVLLTIDSTGKTVRHSVSFKN